MDEATKYLAMKELFANLLALVACEIGWKFFREEMFKDSVSGNNAKNLQDWMIEFKQKHPTLWADIEPIFERINR